MKIYISGPISAKENGNKAAFEQAEIKIRSHGNQPINPHNLNDPNKMYLYADYMRQDIRALIDCEGIYMLKGWEKSKGASVEIDVAKILGMRIFFEE